MRLSKRALPAIALAAFFSQPPTSIAAEVTYQELANAVGLGANTNSEGDQPAFFYKGKLAVVPSKHGNPWGIYTRDSPTHFGLLQSILPSGSDGHGCTAVDLTNPSLTAKDGLVDLMCTEGACQGTCSKQYPKQLWVQRPEGGFVELGAQAGAGLTQGHSRGRDTAAYTLPTGEVVLGFANELSQNYPSQSINRVFWVSNGRFSELPLLKAGSNALANTTGTCVAMVPHVPLPDVLFCNTKEVAAFRYDGTNYHQTNVYGKFTAVDMRGVDLDKNGTPEVLALSQTALDARSEGGGRVRLGNFSRAHGLAYGDMNCDGLGDILVVQSKQAGNSHKLLLNNGNGFSYRVVNFPHPSAGSGDAATYIHNWNGQNKPAMLISHGLFQSGPVSFVGANCVSASLEPLLEGEPAPPLGLPEQLSSTE